MPAPVFPDRPSRARKAGSVGFGMEWTVDLSGILPRILGVIEDVVETSAEGAVDDAKKLAPVRRVVAGDRGGKTRVLTPTERSAEQSVRVQLGLRSGKVIRTAAEDRHIRHMPSNPYLRAPGRRPPRGVDDPTGKRTAPPTVQATGRGFAIQSGVSLNRHGRKELSRGVSIKGPTIYGQGSDAAVKRNRQLLKKTNSAVYFRRHAASSIDPGLRGGGTYTLGGRLRGEIYAEAADVSQGIVKWWVISPTYYARFVEFGTRHNKAQPYMRPALAMQRRKMLDTMRNKLRKLNWKPKRKHVRTRVT